MTKTIRLSTGEDVLVDDADFLWLNRWRWKIGNHGYAMRSVTLPGRKNSAVLMHRLIMDPPSDLQVDHINRNKLDNRRANLRVVPQSINNHNQDLWSRNTSGVRGVVWDKSRSKWMARFTLHGKTQHLGRFDNIRDAAAAYEDAARRAGVR